MTRRTLPLRHGYRLASTSCYRPKVTQTGWQRCGHKRPETSAHQCRRSRSKGSTDCRRAARISIVTINGNFWTTHAEWMAQMAPGARAGAPRGNGKARTPRLAVRFLACETQCAEDENRIISGYVGRHFRRSAHVLGV